MKRTFARDVTRCPRCGGPMRLVALLVEPLVVARILAHLGVSSRAPPRPDAPSATSLPPPDLVWPDGTHRREARA